MEKVGSSVTRLGDLLHFEQLFKACGNNYFTQIAHISVNFCKGFEIFHFSNEIIFGRLFTGHTAARLLSWTISVIAPNTFQHFLLSSSK